MKSFKRYIAEQNEATIIDFVQFASRKLGLRNAPNVMIVPSRENGMTTACYSPVDSSIKVVGGNRACLLYTSPSPRDRQKSRMPSSA